MNTFIKTLKTFKKQLKTNQTTIKIFFENDKKTLPAKRLLKNINKNHKKQQKLKQTLKTNRNKSH